MAKDIGLDLASLPYRCGASVPQRWLHHFHVKLSFCPIVDKSPRRCAETAAHSQTGTFWQPCHLPA